MPKIYMPVKKGYPADSLINMAEKLGEITKTVVECQVTLEVTAAEPVLQALKALVPMAKGRKSHHKKADWEAEAAEVQTELVSEEELQA